MPPARTCDRAPTLPTKQPPTQETGLAAALRKAIADETDAAIREWLRRLLNDARQGVGQEGT